MTPFGLNVVLVECDTPPVKILAAAQVEGLLAPGKTLDSARQKAARLLRRVRRQRAAMLSAAAARSQALVDEAQPRINEDARVRARIAVDQAVQAAVRWMKDENRLEQTVYVRIEAHVRGVLASLLEQLRAPEPMSAMLVSRLQEELVRAGAHPLAVRVHPECVDTVRKALVSEAHASIQPDSLLAPGEAIMSSALVEVRIDLARQLEQVIGAMRGEPSQIGTEDDF